LPGQHFDIRVEVHAPVNGSEAINKAPDEKFTLTIQKEKGGAVDVTKYFNINDPKLERWNFTWYEDLFAEAAKKPSLVNVTSKAYRNLVFKDTGDYTATLTYYGSSKTVAKWTVRDVKPKKKAKNVIFFIGDGMTTNMITAARLIAHKSTNGIYDSLMAMDKFPVLGHQMTHSIDSFITDSANSAMALYTGHKSTVNCLGVYADSSPNKFDDPKVESIAEMFQRATGGGVGIVSTAYIADATPGALTAHTRDRGQYGFVIDSFLNGVSNYSWTKWNGPDVLFGGGAENFFNSSLGGVTLGNKDYYAEFKKKGYGLVHDKDQLAALPKNNKALGIFSVSNMAKWLDRNVYTANLKGNKDAPDGSKKDADNQPGLKEMTLKAIDIAHARSNGKGFFVMSEAASIDKQMHALDYERALGELLELDDTIRATIAKVKEMGMEDETLIVVTADHGHGFDVTGSVDTKWLNEKSTDREKRNAIGTYRESGQSQYVIGNLSYSEGVHFPANWDPRYTLHQGVVAFPDHREDYQVNKDGPRNPSVNATAARNNYIANPKDNPKGFLVNGKRFKTRTESEMNAIC